MLPLPLHWAGSACAWESGAAEVGYWVDPRARKRGVATTAVRAVCQWAATTAGIELIEWRCEVGNVASRRVADKAVFLIEATLRKRPIRHGVRVDEWVGPERSPPIPGVQGGSGVVRTRPAVGPGQQLISSGDWLRIWARGDTNSR